MVEGWNTIQKTWVQFRLVTIFFWNFCFFIERLSWSLDGMTDFSSSFCIFYIRLETFLMRRKILFSWQNVVTSSVIEIFFSKTFFYMSFRNLKNDTNFKKKFFPKFQTYDPWVEFWPEKSLVPICQKMFVYTRATTNIS